jgi:tRNA(His) guanylyltransferase
MKNKTKTLGDILKRFEEVFVSQKLLSHCPIIARIDGRSFHSYTRGFARPFDTNMTYTMISTLKSLVKEFHADIGYTQSDEISLCWLGTQQEPLFDGKVFKLCSTIASAATGFFNDWKPESWKIANFDCRVFNVPDAAWMVKYLIWRERDCTKNSISMAASSIFSPKDLHKKKSADKQEMLFSKGINWDAYPAAFKRGTYVTNKLVYKEDKKAYRHEIVELNIQPLATILNPIPVLCGAIEEPLYKNV